MSSFNYSFDMYKTFQEHSAVMKYNFIKKLIFRLNKSSNLDAIQITKVQGGTLEDSFLDEGKTGRMIDIYFSITKKNCSSVFIIPIKIILYFQRVR